MENFKSELSLEEWIVLELKWKRFSSGKMATKSRRNVCKIEKAAMSLHVLYERKKIRSYVRVWLDYEEHQRPWMTLNMIEKIKEALDAFEKKTHMMKEVG